MAKVARKVVRFAAFVLAVLAVAGCGDSSATVAGESGTADQAMATSTEAPPVGKAQTLKERRRLLRETVPKLARRSKACTILSDHFLRENYGAPGERGRRQCEKVARSRPSQHIRFFKIRTLHLKTATVFMASSAEQNALADFVFTDDEWLLDSLSILGD